MSNHVDEQKKVEAFTAFNRLYLDHCWTTGALEEDLRLSSIESRTGFRSRNPSRLFQGALTYAAFVRCLEKSASTCGPCLCYMGDLKKVEVGWLLEICR